MLTHLNNNTDNHTMSSHDCPCGKQQNSFEYILPIVGAVLTVIAVMICLWWRRKNRLREKRASTARWPIIDPPSEYATCQEPVSVISTDAHSNIDSGYGATSSHR